MGNLSHSFSRPHFNFNPADPKAAEFANLLMSDLGDFDLESADAIINVGGDGTILYSFHALTDLPNFAVKPPTSSSALYYGHHKIESSDDLKTAYAAAQIHNIQPLRLEVQMTKGDPVVGYAYADVVANSFNSQAVLSHESVENKEPLRIMGCGWIVATPMGSTALNETRGGKTIDLDAPSIVVTLDGVSNAAQRKELEEKHYMSRVISNGATFRTALSAVAERRESSIKFDTYTILPDGQLYVPGKPVTIDTSVRSITGMTISMDHGLERRRRLLVNPQYRTPNSF